MYLQLLDEKIVSEDKIDFIAKYSFGLFFVHWYWFFAYNQIFHLPTVALVSNGDYVSTIGIVMIRFLAVALVSLISLFLAKIILLKINPKINTRKFFGI